MSFRILNQAPQYLLPDGSVNAGGSLTFLEADLSAEKDTWSDPDMTVLNANPVLLDAAGRTVTDVWGDGEYGIEMRDALGVVKWTRSPVNNGVAAGLTIPALVNGQFLSNDGSTMQWQPINQVPDPTGLANYVLTSDGTGVPLWQQQTDPTVPDPQIVVAANSFRAGVSTDDTKFLIQMGSGSAPSSGSKATSASVVFSTAFAATPMVFVQPKNGNASSVFVRANATGVSTGGFTASLSTLTGGTSADNFPGSTINTAIAFDWIAFGTVEVAP